MIATLPSGQQGDAADGNEQKLGNHRQNFPRKLQPVDVDGSLS